MRHTIVRAGSLIGVAGAALLVAGGALAATSTAAHTSVTGPEVVSGHAHGKNAVAESTHIPLALTGVVKTTDRGFVLGSGGGNTHTLTTPAGKVTVRGTGKEVQTQTMNARTCRVSYTVRQRFNYVPSLSTGRFAGATGPGAYQIYFAAFVPRYTSGKHKGQCNDGNNVQPLARGAVATFLVGSVITVR
jgi:hypothetical protein